MSHIERSVCTVDLDSCHLSPNLIGSHKYTHTHTRLANNDRSRSLFLTHSSLKPLQVTLFFGLSGGTLEADHRDRQQVFSVEQFTQSHVSSGFSGSLCVRSTGESVCMSSQAFFCRSLARSPSARRSQEISTCLSPPSQ